MFSSIYILNYRDMNTIKKGRFDDTNKIFQEPEKDEIDFEVKEFDADKIKYLSLIHI